MLTADQEWIEELRLKRLLGHEKLETTQDYLQIPFAHVRRAYQASHPLGHDV